MMEGCNEQQTRRVTAIVLMYSALLEFSDEVTCVSWLIIYIRKHASYHNQTDLHISKLGI